MSLAQELLIFGLNNKEADVYVAALELGYASVQEIAEKARINRTTTYTHIKNLISRGLISVEEKFGKLFYVAERPEKFKTIFKQQEQAVNRQRAALESLLPELDSIYSSATDKPSVKYYEFTAENTKKIRKEIQNIRTEEMLNIFNYDKYKQYTNKQHVQILLNNVSKFKALYVSSIKEIDKITRELMLNDNFFLKYLPASKFDFPCEILITGKKVYIARDNDCLIISDKLVAQTLTLLFQSLWSVADEPLK